MPGEVAAYGRWSQINDTMFERGMIQQGFHDRWRAIVAYERILTTVFHLELILKRLSLEVESEVDESSCLESLKCTK